MSFGFKFPVRKGDRIVFQDRRLSGRKPVQYIIIFGMDATVFYLRDNRMIRR